MKTSTIYLIIAAIILIAGGAYYFMSGPTPAPTQTTPTVEVNTPATTTVSSSTQPTNETSTSTSMDTKGGPETSTPKTPATVTLNSSGFSPNTLTIAKGTKVTWMNAGGGKMWVASDAHPNHTQYDNTQRSEHCATGYAGPIPFDECKDSTSYNFTFNQTGTWKYHNHLNPAETGMIVVK